MKIKGQFVLREIAGDTILVPVGQTALDMNSMITLDPTAALIWKALEQGRGREEILEEILNRFDVAQEEAEKDLEEFLAQLEAADLLDGSFPSGQA